ncbi:MAG TPA: DUF3592 domain-containing protein [Candidatus Xenobia bacterium]|jgi:hypothetical protein
MAALPAPPRRVHRRSIGARLPGVPLAIAFVVVTGLLAFRLVSSIQVMHGVASWSGKVESHVQINGKPALICSWQQGDAVRSTSWPVSPRESKAVADGAPVQVVGLEPPLVVLPGHSLWNRIWPLAIITVLWVTLVGSLVYHAALVPSMHRRLVQRGEAVTGEIVTARRVRIGRQESLQLSYRYTTRQGQSIDASVQVPELPGLNAGQKVTVLYGSNARRSLIYEACEFEVS